MKRLVLLTLLIAVWCLVPFSAFAEPKDSQHQVIFVGCDYLQPEDLNNRKLANIYEFFSRGGIALLNTNTAGARNRQNAAATISAGSVALSTSSEPLVLGANESYKDEDSHVVFQARTGITPQAENLVVLDLPLIQWANSSEEITAKPGALGESLHKAGMKTAVIGNADLPDRPLPQRAMSLIAMDQKGLIDSGDVSKAVLQKDPGDPLGYRTDYNVLKKAVLDEKDYAQLLVIELGDLVRLERNRQQLSPSVYFQERERVLQDYDEFLGWLMKETDFSRTQVFVASTTPTVQASSEKRLFGFIGVNGEGVTSGLLATPTTRKPGIVTLYDIAPSISAYLKLPLTQSYTGRPWNVKPVAGNLNIIQDVEKRTVFTSVLRPALVKGYVVIHLIVLASLLFFLVFDPRKGSYLAPFLLGLMAVPLAWLLTSFFPVTDTSTYIFLCLLIDVILVILSFRLARDKEFGPLIILCLATVAALLLDTVTGGALQRYSVLSYDPMGGARFYGIGNEYMGVILGATITGVSLLVQRLRNYPQWQRICAGGLFLMVLMVLGAPQLGSNFGGSLAATFAFGYTFLRLFNVRLQWFEVVLGILLVGVFCSGLLFLDYLKPPALRSHFGQFAFSLSTNGVIALKDVVMRKLAMNYKLIKYTIWTRVLLGTLLALGILFYRPVGIFRSLLTKNPAVAVGLSGGVLGAFAALIFNDSGIVAAATAILFPAATLFYLVIREQIASL